MKFIFSIILSCLFLTSTFARKNETVEAENRFINLLALLGEEKYELAIEELQKLIRAYPAYPKPYRTLVETYVYIQALDSAQVFFNELLARDEQCAYAYYCLARLDYAKGHLDAAIEKLKTAIRLNPDYPEAYSHWGGLPELYRAKGENKQAVYFFENLARKEPANAMAMFGLARSYIRQYDWSRALPLLLHVLKVRPHFTLAYHSLIYIYYSTGQFETAYRLSNQLLKVARAQHDFEMAAYAASMIGNYYFSMGDYAKSLLYLDDALGVAKDIGDKNRQAACLNTIASIYALSGNPGKALQFFRETLSVATKTGNKASQIRALANIGNVYKDMGNFLKALQVFQNAIGKSREYGYKHQTCLTLSNMAEVYEKKGALTKALQTQKLALKLARSLGEQSIEGYILSNLGTLMVKKGDFAAAESYQQQALRIGNAIKEKQILWEAYAGLGEAYAQQGKVHDAIAAYKKAIAIHDSVRASAAIESLGSDFLKDKYEVYHFIIRLLARTDELDEAFEYAEKLRAKAILDIFSLRSEANSAPASDSLHRRLANIRANLDTAHALYSTELLKRTPNQAKILALDQRITDQELQEAHIMQIVKDENREYFSYTYARTISRRQLQETVLEPQETLIQYIVGVDSLLVFIVSKDRFSFLQLPVSRQNLQTMLDALSPLFGEANRGNHTAPILNAQLADFSIPPAHALYKAIFKPLESHFSDRDALIIVRDDILNYLPFEMLIDDTSQVGNRYDFANARFLLEKYSISYATSATMLLRSARRTQFPGKDILAVGNPQFRQPQNPAPQPQASFAHIGAEASPPGAQAISLPHAEEEVQQIIGELGSVGNRILLRQEATEKKFKKAAREYKILHFATHFLVNDNEPLYSKLIFARDRDNSEDGYLQTYEVMKMSLHAEMAVLSACNTGLGKLKHGEGFMGISRAFFQAGVPSVVVSLWNVDDASTATIMRDFYRSLRSGMDKRKALRFAKRNYLKRAGKERYDPFYWAPFILIGDPEPLSLQVPATSGLWKIFAFSMILLVFAFWLLRKFVSSHQ